MDKYMEEVAERMKLIYAEKRENIITCFSLRNNVLVQTAKAFYTFICAETEEAERIVRTTTKGGSVPESYKEIQEEDFQLAFIEAKTGIGHYIDGDRIHNKIELIALDKRKDFSSKVMEILSIWEVEGLEKTETPITPYDDGRIIWRFHYNNDFVRKGHYDLYLEEEGEENFF